MDVLGAVPWILFAVLLAIIAVGFNYAFPGCKDPTCNCRWGGSYMFLGVFVMICATGFLLAGFLIWGLDFDSTAGYKEYHAFNMWWYKLGMVFFVLGLAMNVTYAREPKEAAEEEPAADKA